MPTNEMKELPLHWFGYNCLPVIPDLRPPTYSDYNFCIPSTVSISAV